MIIRPFHKYTVLCSKGNKVYRWHLDLNPQNKAWKIVNRTIEVGDNIKGYEVLHVEEKTFEHSINPKDLPWYGDSSEDNLNFWKSPITKDEFNLSVDMSGIGFAIRPHHGESYRCQLCGGVVANNICTDCMFDWDS